jgi:hypothetical protein
MAGDRQTLHEGGDGMKGLLDNEFDARLLRQAFGCFPSGVTALAPLVPLPQQLPQPRADGLNP